MAGGGINISDKGSGEIDPASELSWLCDKLKLVPFADFLLVRVFDDCASSMTPETSFAGMAVLVECFFLLWGFIEGDCRTVRLPAFDVEVVLLLDFRTDEVGIGTGALKSIFISIGEVASEVSDLGTAPYIEC